MLHVYRVLGGFALLLLIIPLSLVSSIILDLID